MVNQLTEMLPLVGATSEMGTMIMDTIKKFAKHVPPGASTPASERNNIQQMGMKNAQNMQMMQQMRPGAPPQGGQQPGGPPMMAGAA